MLPSMRSFGAVLIALSGVAFASDVLANGGPVDWTRAGLRGGLVPKQSNAVRLRTEDLAITIDPDGSHYDVSAKYLLANTDAEATIRFGVPLLWMDDPSAAHRAADAVRIKVGETESRCVLLKESVTLDVNRYEDMDGTPTGGWCVARLTIPKGDAVPLQLNYRGDLLFTDAEYSKSVFVAFGRRTLRYMFFPAGYWVGPAARVAVTVDLGRYAGTEQVTAPPGVVKQGSKLAWTFTNVDLKKVQDLDLKLDVEPIAYVAELAKYRKDSKVVVAAKAAKAAGGAPAAARAVDGDPETAWCVDQPSPDKWIEVTQRKIDREFRDCNWEGLFLVGTTTEKTARIKRVRLEACHGAKTGDGAPFVDVPLPMRRTGARGPWGLILPGGVYYELPQAEQQAAFEAWHAVKDQIGKCVRVSIVEVEGSGPACIGELTPLRNCG